MKLHMNLYIEAMFYVTYWVLLIDKVQLYIRVKPYRFNGNHTDETLWIEYKPNTFNGMNEY